MNDFSHSTVCSAGLEVTASNYFVEVIVVTCIFTLRFNHNSPEELLRQHTFVLHVTREVDFGHLSDGI